MTRWLVTGAGGMLGRDLVSILGRCGEAVTGLDRTGLDVTDAAAVAAALAAFQPDVVVNCAAWTGVDDAEAHEEQALAVNGGGAANLAAACAAGSTRLVQVSTNYVFAGTSKRPHSEDDIPAPRSAYGRTKLAGERAVLDRLPHVGYVVRTAWLYGAHGPSFARTMIMLERKRPTVDVVDDQYGQPTWTAEVAGQIIALIRSAASPGIYHATSSGQTTWFGLAREISGCWVLILPGSGRSPAARWPGQHPAPPIACSATAPGPGAGVAADRGLAACAGAGVPGSRRRGAAGRGG